MKRYIRLGILGLLVTFLAWGKPIPVTAGSLSSSQAAAVTGTLSNGVLTFSGTGEISENYLCENFAVDDNGCFAAIEKVVVKEGITGIGRTAFVGCGKLTTVTLPDSLVNIGEDAFAWCTSLTTINMPAGVTGMGAEAFRGCTALKTIVLPANLTTIPRRLFQDCTALTTVTFPAGLTKVEASAFAGCKALKTLTLPETVTVIGEYAFRDCTALTRMTVPAGVTKLANGVFYGCTKLQSVTLPAGLTAIGTVQSRDDYDYSISGAFEGCTALKTINLPAGLTAVGDQTFHNCSSLTDVTYGGTSAQWDRVELGMYNADLIHAVVGETAVKAGSTTVDSRHFYTFTPTKDYYYQFTSSVPAGSAELCIYEKVDGDWEWLDQDVPCPEAGDPADHYNFDLVLLLEKGHTYYLEMNLYGAFDRDSFTLKLQEAAPVLTKVKNVEGGVEISWKHLVEYDSEYEDPPNYYRVYRKDMSLAKPTWVKVKDTIANQCIDTNVVSGGNYVYTVRALTPTTAGTRDYLSAFNATGLSICHLSCLQPDLANTADGIKLSWKKVDGAEGYLVYRYADGDYQLLTKITKNSTLSYTHKGTFADGKSCKYAVKAYKGSVYGAWKSASILRLPCLQPTLANTEDGVKLSWSKVSAAQGYIVYQYVDGTYKRLAKITNNTTLTYTHKGSFTNGRTYTYTVKAYRGDCSGAYRNSSIYRLPCMKPTLTNVSDGIKLSWSKVSAAEGYIVYQYVDGAYQRLTTITDNTTLSYTHKGAKTNGQAYRYAVRAYKGSYRGAYQRNSTYRLTAVTQYDPTNLSGRKMRVKWSKNSKASGYQIQYSTNRGFAEAETVTVDSSVLKKDITGLTKGKTYYVRVRAYKKNSAGTKYYSAWSSMQYVTIRK